MLSNYEINETLKMINEDNLDVRTVTMGISLRDCSHEDPKISCSKIYDKITRYASKLVDTACDIEKEFGIPIINKRISVTPISIVAESSKIDNYTCFAEALQKAADETGVNFLGGFSALVHKGCTKGDDILINSIPDALTATRNICSSVNVASTKTGLNMNAVKRMGETIVNLAERTKDQDGIGCAKLVVFSNAVEDNPFMAGAFHGIGEPECVINVGVSGPGVVHSALKKVKGADF